MPYIEKKMREALHKGQKPVTAGELNYAITRMCLEYLAGGLSYRGINEVVGALECCKQEFYRRIAAPYEDKKADINGDVYGG